MKYFAFCVLLSIAIPAEALFSKTATKEKPSTLSQEPLNQEVKFWQHQLIEHIDYLLKGVNAPEAFKTKGKQLQEQLKKFSSVDTQSIKDYKKLLPKIKAYKKQALKYIGHNRALKALINHMLEELTYHADNVNGTVRSLKEEKKFWNNHDKEVDQLEKFVKKGTKEEKESVELLQRNNIKHHEKQEDEYAQKRMSQIKLK